MLNKSERSTTVFIDANIFLYEIFDHWKYNSSCRKFLDCVNSGEYSGVISVLICNEVFHRVMIAEVVEQYNIEPKYAVKHLKKNWEIMKRLNKAWDVIVNIRQIKNLKIVEIDIEVLEFALGYSKKYGLLSNDAIHLATMEKYGLTNIATNDSDFERVDWIKVWKPL